MIEFRRTRTASTASLPRILDQLQLLGRLPSELNVVGLKRLAFAWLTEHGNDISTRSGTIPSTRHGS